jgi:hypothetical protein
MFGSVDRVPAVGGPVVRVPFAAGGGGAAAGDGRVGRAADAANLGPLHRGHTWRLQQIQPGRYL